MSTIKNYFLSFARVTGLITWMIVMPLTFLMAKLLRIPNYHRLPHVFHAGVCKILGLNVIISGHMSVEKPTLYLSNHISYLDVFVLGHVPAYFIAKAEVASWPVLGKLAQFQNTLFVERKAGRAKQQLETLRGHLDQGNSLTLFPEGTSTNGTHVVSFKSTLLESANLKDERRVAIQPITVAYTHYDGQLISDQYTRDFYAWYDRMPFLSHFLALMPRKKVDAKVHFHPVCYLDDFDSRKECALHCEHLVADKLDQFINGN